MRLCKFCCIKSQESNAFLDKINFISMLGNQVQFLRFLAKSSSFIILFLSLLVFYFCFDKDKISTNVLDLFPQNDERILLDIHTNLNEENTLLLHTTSKIDEIKNLIGVDSIIELKENIYQVNIAKDVKLEDFYDEFSALKNLENLKYFSQDILNIENSRAIFSDINIIMISSVSFLILMYLFILRIPYLSLNTIISIVSANLLGISLIMLLYDNVNIMSLNFGIAIGNLAIDYMLHHHFFRIYTHQFKFNKSVFYGFVTTFVGFFLCLLIPFPLLSQLSTYAMVCLFVSYISFGILYQGIKFKKPIYYKNLRRLRKPKIKNIVILGLAILGLAICLPNLELDYNLEKLDFENKPRLSDKDYFLAQLSESKTILIFNKNEDELKKDLLKIAQKFKPLSDILNPKIIQKDSMFYTKMNVAKDSDLSTLENINYDSRTIKELTDSITSGIYKPMIVILSAVVAIMIVVVLIITRSLVSLSFVIFPLAVIFGFLLNGKVNIMHLFSLLIVVVSSIDYGIYVNKEGENSRTLHAIIFSALTTIAGFGFLAFSKILALHSFGIVIILGISAILFLLLIQKR